MTYIVKFYICILRKKPQGFFIFGGKWQMRPFRFRPLFASERKRFSKAIPCRRNSLMEWLYIKIKTISRKIKGSHFG